MGSRTGGSSFEYHDFSPAAVGEPGDWSTIASKAPERPQEPSVDKSGGLVLLEDYEALEDRIEALKEFCLTVREDSRVGQKKRGTEGAYHLGRYFLSQKILGMLGERKGYDAG